LIRWAREQGWRTIEANANEKIPLIYAIAGVAGEAILGEARIQRREFGYGTVDEREFLEAIRKDAVAAGVPAEQAANRHKMRLELTSS
jgi:hypothetical protein